MSAEIIDTNDGILTVKITGQLTQPELAAVQKRAADILRQQSKMSVLVLTENFQGWAKEGDWGDLSFQEGNDPNIERIALVGEQKWENLALIFTGKSFREFPVEFFPPEEAAKARSWLKGRV